MSTVASSPILTTATPATTEGTGAETAPGGIRKPLLDARRRAGGHRYGGGPHRCTAQLMNPSEFGSSRLGRYVRLQCTAAIAHFVRGLAYGAGLSVAGTVAYGLRHLW
ncbi:hypothetical protein [Streptomyces sp. NPDC055055]